MWESLKGAWVGEAETVTALDHGLLRLIQEENGLRRGRDSSGTRQPRGAVPPPAPFGEGQP